MNPARWEGEWSGGEAALAGDAAGGVGYGARRLRGCDAAVDRELVRCRGGLGSAAGWAGTSPLRVSVAHPAMPCSPKVHTHSSARQSPRGMVVVLGVKPALVRYGRSRVSGVSRL